MIPEIVVAKLDTAMRSLSTRGGVPYPERILDWLLEAAAECKRLECVATDQLQFKVGQLDQKSYRFGDCVGRFRGILPLLCFRCEKLNPRRFEGGAYGFEADVILPCGECGDVHYLIKTVNTQSAVSLLMEVQPDEEYLTGLHE